MRPAVFQVGGVVYWTLLTRNPDTGVLKDADSTPTVAVRKNGSSVADSVTVTKRSATTGIYDCSYNPAGEVEGDAFTLEESATVTGTTTSSATYNFAWSVRTVRTGAVTLDPSSRVKLDADQPDYDLPTNTELNAALAASDDATLAAIAAEAVKTAAIKAKTDNLPSDPADQSLIIAATDAVMTRLGAPAGASIAADIAAIDGGGGGGGDATLAKQDEILAAIQGSEVIQVASPNVSGNLVLTQGDDYDGTANPKASWTVSTDYTDGWSVTLTIRDADDEVVYTTAGEVVSPTVVAVTIAAPTGLTMTGCPGQWQGKFDVQLTKAGKKKTIALGVCYINEDQTR